MSGKNLKKKVKVSANRAANRVRVAAAQAQKSAQVAVRQVSETVQTSPKIQEVQKTAQEVQKVAAEKFQMTAEQMDLLRQRFEKIKRSEFNISIGKNLQTIKDRASNFRQRAFEFGKNLWSKDGWQKLVITTGLGIATLVAAGIAEDRGRQVQALRAAVTAQRSANQQLAQQVSQTQAEIDEKNLKLMVAEQAQAAEQLKMEKQLAKAKVDAVQKYKAKIKPSKSAKKEVASKLKKRKKTMIATAKGKSTKAVVAKTQKTKFASQKKNNLTVSKAE